MLVAISDNLQEKRNEYRIIFTINFSGGGIQTKTIEELLCSPSLEGGHQSASVSNLRHPIAANF